MSSFLQKLRIKPLDFVFLFLFAAAAVFSVLQLSRKNKGSAVLIVDSPSGQYVYDMSVNRNLRIRGLIGDSLIKIQDGKAFFVDSPCPNKTCVQCTPISHNLEWIACMPNQVFIRVEQESEQKDSADVSSF